MAEFTRKNVLNVSVQFLTSGAVGTQPTTAEMVLSFRAYSTNVATTAIVPLTYNGATSTWSATWDSSAAAPGQVAWTAVGTPGFAQDGTFILKGNAANIATP